MYINILGAHVSAGISSLSALVKDAIMLSYRVHSEGFIIAPHPTK